jgi:hypothetical protein
MAPSTKGRPSNKIFVTLPKGARALFDQLVDRKFYGAGNSEVARHLIITRLDELVEKGRLIEDPPTASPSKAPSDPNAAKT